MAAPLRVLLVEDSDDDARLLVHALERGGYHPDWKRVDTIADLADALDRHTWDIIFCDYILPQLTVATVLQALPPRNLDLPVIIVSGQVGEEYAVEVLRAGARDYIRKDNVARLVPAVARELHAARTRQEQRQVEQAFRASEERFSNAFQYAPIGMAVTDATGRPLRVNRVLCEMLGYTADELLTKSIADVTHPDDIELDRRASGELIAARADRIQIEKRYLHKDGRIVWALVNGSVVRDPQGSILYAIAHVQDITETKTAAEALRRSESYFRSLIEQTLDLISIIHPDGTVRFASPSHHAVLGYTPEELIGRNAFDLIHPDDLPTVLETFARGVGGIEQVVSSEFRFRHKDGSWRMIEGSAKNLFADPIVAGAVVCSRDVTDRHRSEVEKAVLLEIARAIASTVQLDDILDRVHQQTATTLPCDRVVTYFWDEPSGVFRLARHWGVPDTTLETVREIEFTRDHPLIESLATGKTLVMNDVTAQSWLDPRWIAEVSAVAAVPLMVRQRMEGILVAVRATDAASFEARAVQLLERIAQEVALAVDRAQIQRAQQEEAEVASALVRFGREIISALDQPVLLQSVCRLMTEVLDCDGSHTLLWDPHDDVLVPTSQYGDSSEEWETIRVLRLPRAPLANLLARIDTEDAVQLRFDQAQDLVPLELARRYGISVGLYVALRRGQEVIGIQTANYRGRTRLFSAQQVRIAKGIGQLASLALANSQVVEALERVSRLKSDFVATMSHELRTPLNVILGYNDLLLDGAFGALTPAQTESLEYVHRSATELFDLITGTLDLSRLETGRLPLESQLVSVASFLAEMQQAAATPLNDKPEITVEWNAANAPAELWTDLLKLKVVVKNLLSNAIKFTDRGTVNVSLAAHDDGLTIAIADTGIGIPPEVLPFIFEPFRQGDSSMTRRHGGVGLGLYIVRRLLELMGGTVDVESTAGVGSTFRVWVPGRRV